jgi:tetratricopeptide (TPR) repeat protein
MNRFDEAIEAVRQAIHINPDYFDAYGVLGSLYGQTKRYEESLDAFNHALSLDSRNADVYDGLGSAYEGEGRYAALPALMLMAIERWPLCGPLNS